MAIPKARSVRSAPDRVRRTEVSGPRQRGGLGLFAGEHSSPTTKQLGPRVSPSSRANLAHRAEEASSGDTRATAPEHAPTGGSHLAARLVEALRLPRPQRCRPTYVGTRERASGTHRTSRGSRPGPSAQTPTTDECARPPRPLPRRTATTRFPAASSQRRGGESSPAPRLRRARSRPHLPRRGSLDLGARGARLVHRAADRRTLASPRARRSRTNRPPRQFCEWERTPRPRKRGPRHSETRSTFARLRVTDAGYGAEASSCSVRSAPDGLGPRPSSPRTWKSRTSGRSSAGR